MLVPRWRWNSAAARHGQPGMQTRRSWQAFWPSAAVGASFWTRASARRPQAGRAETLTVFGLAPGKVLPLPAVEDALWNSLTLDAQPPAMTVAQALYPTDPARRDDAYSELCSKRSRGRAVVWALQQGEQTVCTVGAYAVANGQAYMACGQTAEPLRGKGIGGRLIVQMANALAAEGEHPVFLCAPERVHFYTRLGFAKLGEYVRFAAP